MKVSFGNISIVSRSFRWGIWKPVLKFFNHRTSWEVIRILDFDNDRIIFEIRRRK